jgi:hypothetical protein
MGMNGCRGIMIGLVLGCVLWAAVLVPLIYWGWDAAWLELYFGGAMLTGYVLARVALREPRERP